MSLMSAETRATPVWQRSIAGRLVVLYTLTTTALLLAAIAAIYFALARHIDEEDVGFLTDRLHEVRTALEESEKPIAQLVREFPPPSDAQPSGHFIRILDERGVVLAAMPGMAEQLPISIFPPPAMMAQQLGRTIEYRSSSGRGFLLAAAWAKRGGAEAPALLVQIAQDRSDDQTFMNGFRMLLGGLLLAGAIAAAGLGGMVARRGLRPLQEITATVQGIGVTQLHARIAEASWPDELQSLATAFDAMLRRLEEAFARLSQFSADLAHELRTPIGVLRGETEVALSRGRSADEYREVLISSMDEFTRLSRMIDGLLFLARAENPETRIECAPIQARQECNAIIAFHEAVAQEQDVTLAVDGEAFFKADATLFRRAVTNLVTNALQHSLDGGSVTVRLLIEGESALVRVSDTGAGIAAEHLPRLFDRFYRADPSRHAGGTGLGLAIVKSVVELHGGSVGIESTVGRGSTVTLRFPREGMPRAI
jgi:two-component system heavy metal sensor histidine kinase CusS